tara:strand:+ start:548 stop:1489 length:942 start_codon:yes stop_codon:yes gene_type:complete
MRDEFLWVEKYRPKTISECILPTQMKKTFLEFVKNKEIPNLLLHGNSGIGKTTVARALCEELGCDSILINGSDEGRYIDTFHTKIASFASSISLGGNRKIIIIDEADYLNPQSIQPAMRAFIEEFSSNCGFIFTCNYVHKILPAIHSRCSVIDFRLDKGQEQAICMSFMQRVIEILNAEDITYNEEVIAQLIWKFRPDWRRVLNEIQRYSSGGEINVGILSSLNDENFEKLAGILEKKKFTDIRQWVVDNLDSDPATIYRKLYDNLTKRISPNSVPDTVLVIGEYSYKSAFVADQEINLICCLIELANSCEFV